MIILFKSIDVYVNITILWRRKDRRERGRGRRTKGTEGGTRELRVGRDVDLNVPLLRLSDRYCIIKSILYIDNYILMELIRIGEERREQGEGVIN